MRRPLAGVIVSLFLDLVLFVTAYEVLHRGPSTPGRQFDLTEALARRLGLVGVQRITWSYAGAR